MRDAADYFRHLPGAALPGPSLRERCSRIDLLQGAGAFGLRPRLEAFHGPASYSYGVPGTFKDPGKLYEEMAYYGAVAGTSFDSCLANLYRTGSDSVAWHADNEKDMGPVVLSASYGASRRFSVRCNESRQVTNYTLADGDLFVMLPGAQDYFQHCIRKTKAKVGPRLSLTFRKMK